MFHPEEEALLVTSDNDRVKSFLAKALETKIKGDASHYKQIVEQLITRNDEDMLWRLLISLSSNISRVTQKPNKFRELIQSIYSYDWKCSFKVTVAFINLLSHIVSSNVTFLAPSLHILVKSFIALGTITPSLTFAAAPPSSSSSNSSGQLIPEIGLDLVHRAITGLQKISPMAAAELLPILIDSFPHKRFAVDVQTVYISQLLRVCEYMPSIQQSILGVIVSRCLEIDVEIIVEDSGDVKIEEHEQDGELFNLDEDNHILGHTGPNEIGQEGGREQLSTRTGAHRSIPPEVVEMADKLDSMLLLIINFFKVQLEKKGRDEANVELLFKQLLTIFEERVLSTHRSKFVQFILFYFVSKSPTGFAEKYSQWLIDLFIDPSVALVKRQSAIMYLASYMARSTFLPLQHISHILAGMLGWASAYVTHMSAETTSQWRHTPSLANSTQPPQDDNSTSSNCSSDRNGVTFGDILASTAKAHSQTAPSSAISSASSSVATSSAYVWKYSFPAEVNQDDVDEFGRKSDVATAMAKHETFFYCVQALCYVLCFYGVEAATEQRMCADVRDQWERVLTSRLNPLKYCLHTVRFEFLRLAEYVGLLSEECWGVLPEDLLVDVIAPTNTTRTARPSPLRYSGGSDGMGRRGLDSGLLLASGCVNPLDAFFPFDPCLLSGLHTQIVQSYRLWQSIPELENEDYGSDEDEEEDCDSESVYSSASVAMQASSYQDLASSISTTSGTEAAMSLGFSGSIGSMPGEFLVRSLTRPSPAGNPANPIGAIPPGVNPRRRPRGYSNTSSMCSSEVSSPCQTPDAGRYETHDGGTPGGVGSVSGAAWPVTMRRPRLYSIGSTGSW